MEKKNLVVVKYSRTRKLDRIAPCRASMRSGASQAHEDAWRDKNPKRNTTDREEGVEVVDGVCE